jgi:hypothetical protein
MSPQLQVQGGIKATYQEILALLLLPFSHLAELVTPSLNKAILPHPIHVLCLDFSIWSTNPGSITDCTSAINSITLTICFYFHKLGVDTIIICYFCLLSESKIKIILAASFYNLNGCYLLTLHRK